MLYTWYRKSNADFENIEISNVYIHVYLIKKFTKEPNQDNRKRRREHACMSVQKLLTAYVCVIFLADSK